MDWNAAIERNRQALRRVLASLVAMAGLGSGRPGPAPAGDEPTGCPLPTAGCPTLPRHLHRAVLRLLRPAEAAARRLVIVMARDLAHPEARGQGPVLERQSCGAELIPPAHRHKPRLARRRRRDEARRPTAVPALPLFDTLPRLRARRRPAGPGVPRISLPGHGAPAPIVPRLPPMPDDAIDAARLSLRLRALAAALDDLPAHARRFARWRQRRDALAASGRAPGGVSRRPALRRIWPLRPGRPPGWRRPGPGGRARHPVQEVLDDAHDLALWAMERADTS